MTHSCGTHLQHVSQLRNKWPVHWFRHFVEQEWCLAFALTLATGGARDHHAQGNLVLGGSRIRGWRCRGGAGQESNAMGAARTGMDEDCRYGSHRRVGGHERTGLDGKHARPRDDSLFRSPVKMIF
jgi:hypothetical protein